MDSDFGSTGVARSAAGFASALRAGDLFRFFSNPFGFFLSLRVSWNMHSRVGGSSEEAISITPDPLNLDRVPIEQPGRQCEVVDSHMRF